MVVRSPVRSPVRNVVQSVFGAAEAFNPFQLFTSGAQGAWYDPSDYSTLYQDAAGTTPVTAVEQPVRLMLDRSKGLVPGGELVTINSATLTGSTGFTAITGASCVAGRSYSVSYTCVLTGGTIQGVVGGTALTSTSVSGTFSFIVVATSSVAPQFYSSAGVGSISNYSIRELPGNHALAPNDASRPVLRSRYNLLTRSEEFDDGVWAKVQSTVTANAAVAPDGTMTADFFLPNTTSNQHRLDQTPVTVAGSQTFSVFVKASGYDFVSLRIGTTGKSFNLNSGVIGTAGTASATITAFPNGWYRCAITVSAAANDICRINVDNADSVPTVFTGDGTSGILLWGAQLLTAADHAATGGAYQRVGSATDYDTGPPWRPYLAFDGSDDSMSTSSIDFSGTDKMTVFAGVKQQSPNTNSGQIIELSADVGLNNGAFGLAWPANTDINTLRFQVRGTTFVGVNDAAATTQTNTVISMQADISAPSIVGRRNGTQVASSISSLGTGNFGNYPLFIGRRNNTSNPFNGRLYSLAVLGRTATAPELTAMETWIAGKTGVSL